MDSPLDNLKSWPIRLATVALAGALLLDQCGAYQVDDYARDIHATVQTRTVTDSTRSIPLHWGIDDMGELPDDAFGLVGITATDIYPGSRGGFVFGQAWSGRRVAVASLARLTSDDPSTTLARTFGTVSHEIGHLFGIAHCIYFWCNMNAANTRRQMDRQPLHLGPIDLRKLHAHVGFDPAARYRELRDAYRRHGLTEAADWLDRRLNRLR